MASPLGHALAGYAIGRGANAGRAADVRLLAVCAALAVAPDLDFLPGVLAGRPAAYHQGISHSLTLAIAVGAIAAAALAGTRAGFPRLWLICSAAYASHLAIDLVGQDARAPFGIPLFWPISSETWLSPVTLLPGIAHASSSEVTNAEWLRSIFTLHNARALLLELALACPLLAIAALRARKLGQVTS